MKVLVLILFLIIGMAAGGGVHAAHGFSLPGGRPSGGGLGGLILVADQVKSLESVLQAIQQRLPGRALDARMVERGGRQVYQIRWMGENGKVHDITADAVSGDIVEQR